MTRSTHTFVRLGVSAEAFKEILDKLIAAGYSDQIHQCNDYGWLIDTHGIAICPIQPIHEEEHGLVINSP
jgi:hypothetical protein